VKLDFGNARSATPISTARGFSLLELFLVISIIVVLFTLYFSSGSKNFQERKISECQKNLQNIYAAFRTYALDNNDALPALPGAQTSEAPLSLLIPKFTTGSEFFICPGSKDKPLPDAQPFANRKISYAFYMGRKLSGGAGSPLMSDEQVNTLAKTAGQNVFSPDGKPPGDNHNKFGGNVLFCDGNVQSTPAKAAFDLPTGPGVTLLNPKP
jgi:prepilin-type processing-associated H-X9-DG protein